MMTNSSLSFELRRQHYMRRVACAPPHEASAALPAPCGQPHDTDERLRQIIARRDLFALFQPIVDLRRGRIFGFEGLIRGPENSPLHSPLHLFEAAESCGMREEIEHLCRRITLESFKLQNLPDRLFLNVSPECLLKPGARSGETLNSIRELGIDPSRVVIELTENQPTFDFELMREAVRHYRAMGFSIAIDDLGQGFSSLRLWSELSPEFVKIDKHFVQGVEGDAIKRQFLRSIQEIARKSGTSVIAEGIEIAGEMRHVRSSGIALGQGYFFARPMVVPPVQLSEELACLLREGEADRIRQGMHNTAPRASEMVRDVPVAGVGATTEEVYAIFERNPGLQSLPILQDERPVGLVSRIGLIDGYARPYRRELYGRKPCTMIMDHKPLLVEAGSTLQELSLLLAEGDQRHLADGFLVVDGGRYLGFGSGHDVVREITRLQIEAARHANPLTDLPGNVPLNERIDLWLADRTDFRACYCDLDNFKPFNDVYGYSRGDDLIKLLAAILRAHCHPETDFIGHIGGDDFLVLFASDDWEMRCQCILAGFAGQASDFFSAADRERGGYVTENRQGEKIFMPLVSLSLGVIHVESDRYSAYHQVAAAAAVAKKEAKKLPGNSIFIERREIDGEAGGAQQN
ncbi:MAG: GGDEF domain-containing protein [Rhodocyclaceae bacterium]|nr:GGDEF domain-containing protein [Rhodocyclaceae bacterium]